jgi:TRAP-type transport system small permease protein
MKGSSKSVVFTINKIHNYFVYFAMILIVIMTLVISVNVFMRYVLNSGLKWGEEVAKLLVVWFTYISLAVGVKQGLHISLGLLPKNLPRWFDAALDYLKIAVIISVAVVMIIFGFKLVSITSSSIMPATKWPSSTLYFIVPFSGILVLLEAVIVLLKIDDAAMPVEAVLQKLAESGKRRLPGKLMNPEKSMNPETSTPTDINENKGAEHDTK